MSSTTQPTIDGATAPPPPPPLKRGGRPRLPQHLQTLRHERAREAHDRRRHTNPHYGREVERKRTRLRRITSPPLPFKPLTPAHKMGLLLDWHTTTNLGSHYDWEVDQQLEWEEQQHREPTDDSHRFMTSPPKHRETYEKRKPFTEE